MTRQPTAGQLSVLTALALALAAPAAADDASAPRRITLELPGPPSVTPSPARRRRALFVTDRRNRALACRRPAGPDGHRCSWAPTATLRLGRGIQLWAGIALHTTEWDGMYSRHEDVVLLRPGGRRPRVVGTLSQWRQSVNDCATNLLMRRLALRDLDGDGVKELCLETVIEDGAGLFEVLDLGQRPWVPMRRQRSITAWRLDPRRSRLARAQRLAARCPRRGYALLVRTTPLADAVAARRRVQGADRGRRPTPRRPRELGYGCR